MAYLCPEERLNFRVSELSSSLRRILQSPFSPPTVKLLRSDPRDMEQNKIILDLDSGKMYVPLKLALLRDATLQIELSTSIFKAYYTNKYGISEDSSALIREVNEHTPVSEFINKSINLSILLAGAHLFTAISNTRSDAQADRFYSIASHLASEEPGIIDTWYFSSMRSISHAVDKYLYNNGSKSAFIKDFFSIKCAKNYEAVHELDEQEFFVLSESSINTNGRILGMLALMSTSPDYANAVRMLATPPSEALTLLSVSICDSFITGKMKFLADCIDHHFSMRAANIFRV